MIGYEVQKTLTQLLQLTLQGFAARHAVPGLEQLLGLLADVLHQPLLAQQLVVERLVLLQFLLRVLLIGGQRLVSRRFSHLNQGKDESI